MVQDIVHCGTKLKTRFLKPGIILPLGKFFASVAHVKEIIKMFPKNYHSLTMSILNHADKMNFRSVQLLTTNKVQDCLRQVEATQAPECT